AMANAPAPDIQITEGTKAVINDAAVVAPAEKVLKAAFGDMFRVTPPGHPERGFFRVHQCRRALDVLQYRRLRSRARRRRAQWRPAASRQPFPAVRAGAEADHPDRRHCDDARGPERIRPEGHGAVTGPPAIARDAKARSRLCVT